MQQTEKFLSTWVTVVENKECTQTSSAFAQNLFCRIDRRNIVTYDYLLVYIWNMYTCYFGYANWHLQQSY